MAKSLKQIISAEFRSGRNLTIRKYLEGRDVGEKNYLKKLSRVAFPDSRAFWLGRLRGLSDIRAGRVNMDMGRGRA